jgi:prepilin-type N-terminal cleavage/methylation domain-containing protein
MGGDAMQATNVGAARSERGMSLVELVVALVVLSIGVLAIGGVFPAGSRAQLQDKMMTTGSYYAQQKIEDLEGLTWSDATLTDGRHPAGTATESLGSGSWQRFYQVTTMAAPLDNLKQVTVTVTWTFMGARTVSATTYLRQ